MSARRTKAYVWQRGRFEGDVDFWRHGLTKSDEVRPVKDGECLRLFLYTADDFEYFRQAATEKLQSAEWFDGSPEEEMEEVE